MVRELIRMFDLEKILGWVVCILILMFAFNLKIVSISTEQADKILSYKRQHYTVDIKEDELNDFMKIYPKFNNDGISKRIDADYLMEYPDSADWITKRWFVYQAWDLSRFFYVQKRLKKALEIIRIRNQAAGFVSQLEGRDDEISKQMLKVQKGLAENKEDFSDEELALIEKKAVALKNLFE